MRAENFVVLRAQFLNGGKKLHHEAHKELGKHLYEVVEKKFPAIFKLLKVCLKFKKLNIKKINSGYFCT
jgi:hypothetical protein